MEHIWRPKIDKLTEDADLAERNWRLKTDEQLLGELRRKQEEARNPLGTFEWWSKFIASRLTQPLTRRPFSRPEAVEGVIPWEDRTLRQYEGWKAPW